MGLALALLAYSDAGGVDVTRPVHDEDACNEVVRRLFPRTRLVPSGTTELVSLGLPDRGALAVAAFDGGVLISTRDAHLYNPSTLHRRYLNPGYSTVQLLTQRSFNDMFAYGRWTDGKLVRSLSANPVGMIWESVGEPERWELPFWNGTRPVEVRYPLPFHPLEMSNAALASELRLAGDAVDPAGLCPLDEVVLTIYGRKVSR